jgi:hypothetical protein
LVEMVRFEPTHPMGRDLQSPAPLQLRRISIYYSDIPLVVYYPKSFLICIICIIATQASYNTKFLKQGP